MKKNKLFLILFCLPLLYGCPVYDPPQKYIEVLNDTDSAIYVYGTCHDSIGIENRLYLFPEYFIKDAFYVNRNRSFKDTIVKIYPHYRISPHTGNLLNLAGQKSLLNKCPDKKIRIFFIKEETMRTRSWEDIVQYQLYEKKGIYSEEELKKTDWTVTYP